MNAPEKLFLPDIQASADSRCVAIQHVGIRGVRYPLQLAGQSGVQATVAQVTMTVGLPPEVRGTHMSRFLEILERPRGPLSMAELSGLLGETLKHLDAQSGAIEFAFPWFLRKAAPVSGVESLLDIDAVLRVSQPAGGWPELSIEVRVPVTSLCPCSKKISDYGAHNQRSLVSIAVVPHGRDDALPTLEELVDYAEASASCAVFGLLKRPDEKWVTERAYDNPKFVEDLVRDVALRLKSDKRLSRWSVTAENFESIHNHSAYAEIHGTNG